MVPGSKKTRPIYAPKCVNKCAVQHALEIIGGKWRLAIIWHLSLEESMRYNELKRQLGGITNIMLTRSLQALQNARLVNRVEHKQIPPHVEYSLTESCIKLLPALQMINQWGQELLLDTECGDIGELDKRS